MTFAYKRVGNVFMPVIPVVLRRVNRVAGSMALIDSGATCSIFDAEMASVLGIEEIESGSCLAFEGATGHTFVGYSHSVDLEIGGVKFCNVDIAFTEGMPDNAVNILGQRGFFELCPVRFVQCKNEVDVQLRSRYSKI